MEYSECKNISDWGYYSYHIESPTAVLENLVKANPVILFDLLGTIHRLDRNKPKEEVRLVVIVARPIRG